MIALFIWIVSLFTGGTILHSNLPCATSMEDAKYEDEVCATWIEDGEVVLGPLWSRE